MFEPRLAKYEEWIERQIVETAEEIVCDFYSVDSVYELSEKQIKEVSSYREAMNEYSPLFFGFGEIIYTWQTENDMEIL